MGLGVDFVKKKAPKPTLDPLLGHFQPMTKKNTTFDPLLCQIHALTILALRDLRPALNLEWANGALVMGFSRGQFLGGEFAGPEKLGLAPGETFCRTFLQNPGNAAVLCAVVMDMQARSSGFSSHPLWQ